MLKKTTLVGYVLVLPVEMAFLRIVVGLLVSIAHLIALLATKPYIRTVDGQLATGCAATLVFIFFGALLIRVQAEITEQFGVGVAASILVFNDPESLTAVLIALCFSSLAMLLVLTLNLVRRERRERLDIARWTAQTLNPPTFKWRASRHYAAFLSCGLLVESGCLCLRQSGQIALAERSLA